MFDVARIAGDPRPILKHLPANPTLSFICEPQFGSPVHTDDMRPLFLTRIYRFHDSVQVGTQETLYFITGFLLLDYHLTASTVPWHIILRKPMLDVTPVAALMHRTQAQLTNNNFVALRVVLFKAYITDDVDSGRVLILSRRAVVACGVDACRGLVLSSLAFITGGVDACRGLVLPGFAFITGCVDAGRGLVLSSLAVIASNVDT